MENQDLEQGLVAEVIDEKELEAVKEMMRAGLMYGHRKAKTNPKFKQYIYGARNGVEIIDLSQTITALAKAAEFLKSQIKEGKLVLVVATQAAAKDAVDLLAEKFKFSRIYERWAGGLLTNFGVISKRIEYLKRIEADLQSGKLDKYTKKEKVMINREIERMKKLFGGLRDLTRLPDLLFVIDPSIKGHTTAIHEAKITKVPVMAILDSDDDPTVVEWPIPANDHSKMSIDWVINKIIAKLQD
ncbi:30S ribosomal protein S2 [Candidatus Wolfebacteria bacterium CG_4_10_14_0_2_um_filter_39_18]|uniref:Small ribosomal subunit protein uS2 n=1 Tax=Candidatus Wolfebacteria bacterium CG_4_10_14_0_2_um_filter_39_18 TaxID=1975061 RepID=A0A2M7TGQ3_9BACT|nr:MAG: 30S ribosomal protein S2 [Candidatus Wolfebacteria bacterium CG_4_10_14_0_2_um_filter_39_18]